MPKKKQPASRKPRLVRRFRVYIEQVNQTYVEVSAVSRDEAMEKAYRKWRREDGHSRITEVTELPNDEGDGLHSRTPDHT